MALINKIEQLIKREKLTPERVIKDDSKKSSSEILSELFGVFNAAPPKLEDLSLKEKKSKKSKKKHKKEKKKRSHSCSSASDGSDYKHKKRKKVKSKKHHNSDSVTPPRSLTPPKSPPKVKVKVEIDQDKPIEIKSETSANQELKTECQEIISSNEPIEIDSKDLHLSVHPLPESIKIEVPDIKTEIKKGEILNTNDSEKCKGKILIKNLKYSTVFEQNVKQAEEEARKKKEKLEEGEYSDSSSSCENGDDCNSQFPKTSDPGGILKQQAAGEAKLVEEEKNKRKSHKSDTSHKSSHKKSRDRSQSRKSFPSRLSWAGIYEFCDASDQEDQGQALVNIIEVLVLGFVTVLHLDLANVQGLEESPDLGRDTVPDTPPGTETGDLEVARRNAINMLKNGAVPAGAAVLPPHTRNQVMAAIQSGGKSVDELTDFCKNLSKKEALGELSSVSSNEGSDNEDTLAFHHPFLVKEKAPIVMNIRPISPSIRCPMSTLEASNALLTSLRLRVSIGGGDHLRFDGSPVHLLFANIIKKKLKTVSNLPKQIC
ncbi:hypothetical protein EVAR_11511_1 [Eumeta japonica]|uniref:Protein SON n=1 Tax=Eumeta variegata TaxID=151549 RepID=A0A4C1TYP8_EUMVA|nr:hypothetical protein EVAR_11511_1 [Eumeta japonica]